MKTNQDFEKLFLDITDKTILEFEQEFLYINYETFLKEKVKTLKHTNYYRLDDIIYNIDNVLKDFKKQLELIKTDLGYEGTTTAVGELIVLTDLSFNQEKGIGWRGTIPELRVSLFLDIGN